MMTHRLAGHPAVAHTRAMLTALGVDCTAFTKPPKKKKDG